MMLACPNSPNCRVQLIMGVTAFVFHCSFCQMLQVLNPSVVQTESALVPIPKRSHGKQNSARYDVLAVSHFFLLYHSVLKVRVAFSPGCSRIKSSGLCGPKLFISNFSSNDNVLNCTLNNLHYSLYELKHFQNSRNLAI